MIAVVQRVTEARVKVGERVVGEIGAGLLVLVSIVKEDDERDVAWMAAKLPMCRLFRDATGEKHFDRNIGEAGGSVLLVSNFTVAADMKKGRRPSFDAAAAPEAGRVMFDRLVGTLRKWGMHVETGEFGADMRVTLVNDGPATFIIDSRG